jgi:23S rRNA pseudouridine2457 synthase
MPGFFVVTMLQYFVAYKPYQVLSQFTSEPGKKSLADVFDLRKDVYPVGRLDNDTEGLLILTNDSQLNHRLLHPSHKHEREYWVQVEGQISQQALDDLQSGVTISIDGRHYKTLPCSAAAFTVVPLVEDRYPPIRFRKSIPASWIRIALVEGKNRQVRRMTAKVGYPTLRLIRYRIEKITLEGLKPGELKELSRQEMFSKLFA